MIKETAIAGVVSTVNLGADQIAEAITPEQVEIIGAQAKEIITILVQIGVGIAYIFSIFRKRKKTPEIKG